VYGTPLHLACYIGSLKIVQMLILNNADFNIKNAKGKVPKEVTKN
jgi:ankyrin repeat protein